MTTRVAPWTQSAAKLRCHTVTNPKFVVVKIGGLSCQHRSPGYADGSPFTQGDHPCQINYISSPKPPTS